MDLATFVRSKREAMGLTQAEVIGRVRAAGQQASEATIGHVETGRRGMSYDMAEALATALDLADEDRVALHRLRRERHAKPQTMYPLLPIEEGSPWWRIQTALREMRAMVETAVGEFVDLVDRREAGMEVTLDEVMDELAQSTMEDMNILLRSFESLAEQIALMAANDVTANLSEEDRQIVSDLVASMRQRRSMSTPPRERLALAADTGNPSASREPGDPSTDVEPEPEGP